MNGLGWIIHEPRRLQMNDADAAGSACPKGKNAGLGFSVLLRKPAFL
jgi:hypothetical protein